MISIIAAVGQQRELGKQGRVIWSFREDLDFYLNYTRGKHLLVGKRTYDGLEVFPKGATILVLNEEEFDAASRRQSAWGRTHTHVVTDLAQVIAQYQSSPEELVVVGGAGVYAQTVPYASKLYLTEIAASDPAADVFFPEFDQALFTRRVLGQGRVADGENAGLSFEFVEYLRQAPITGQ